MNTNIECFARDHHLRLNRTPKGYKPGPPPDCLNIPGRRGWITGGATSMKLFVKTNRVEDTLRQAEKLGMEPQGRGDHELMLWFDPSDPEHRSSRRAWFGAGHRWYWNRRPMVPCSCSFCRFMLLQVLDGRVEDFKLTPAGLFAGRQVVPSRPYLTFPLEDRGDRQIFVLYFIEGFLSATFGHEHRRG